jgi:hypothetical protein
MHVCRRAVGRIMDPIPAYAIVRIARDCKPLLPAMRKERDSAPIIL